MLPNYDFFSPGRIVFGPGRRNELGSLVREQAERAFVISGSRTLEASGTLNALLDHIRSAGIVAEHVATISREPEVRDVDDLVADLRHRGAGTGDCLVAIGGGSAIDLAKAASALVTNCESSTVKDYLEGVGAGLSIKQTPIPLIALPTTAGTGTEATKNAVISSYAPAFKKSLRSSLMIPRAVLIDPELALGLAPETTAFTGMDAITQLIESYVSCRAKPLPDAVCLHGIELAIPAIIECVRHGESVAARSAMAHAALLSGIALANAGLGLAHGVAAALGVHARIPHGQACAIMLPVAMRTNRAGAVERLARLGKTMGEALIASDLTPDDLRAMAEHHMNRPATGPQNDCAARSDLDAEFAVSVVETLCLTVQIPVSLTAIGVRADQIPAIVQSSRGNSMSGNPVQLTDSELTTILNDML